MKTPLFLFRIFKYEYWPWWMFYLPVLPYWAYLSLKNKSFAYFSVANPGIELGGFFGESKSQILALIDQAYLPGSISVTPETKISLVLQQLSGSNMSYPIIAKPDVGERGNDVCKIANEKELTDYHWNADYHYIIQEFIDYNFEFGVLYSRLPGYEKGNVSSVTMKEFLTVVGNGESNIAQLMKQSTRARFQIQRLKKAMGNAIYRIPAKNESVLLEPIGNHCRGTRFINYNHVINNSLNEAFDRISLPIKGFYYGRFDLKAKSVEDLQQGRFIKIMELNGASSEPGHIYDTSFTLIKAYRDLLGHWKRLADISGIQMKNGMKPVSFALIVRSYWKFVVLKKSR